VTEKTSRGVTPARQGQLFLQWAALGAAVGAASGVASAVFLALLDRATTWRISHEWVIYALPLAGLLVGAIYQRWGGSIKGGNNLVIDTLHDGALKIPLRMAPMVLLGTVMTHLFGGSAGREGTAVQMGASLADQIARRFHLGSALRRAAIAAGIAGGFGSVFGTPTAGVIFGLEVVCVGRIEYDALVPALVASVVGDQVTRALGIVHTAYPLVPRLPLSPAVMGKLVVMGAIMALVTVAFVELTHLIKARLERRIPRLPIRMFLGGLAVVGMWRLIGTGDYLGLGVPMILRAFDDPQLPGYAFAAKLIFTAVTLGCGFLGGEVTPLFFVGATLGNVLARLLGLPLGLGAGVGLAAVFGAAANTPLALSIMVVELLGSAMLPHVLIVTVVSYLLSGHRGIYPAQRLLRKKHGTLLDQPIRLQEYRDRAAARPPSRTPPSPPSSKD
jgi:H+/Cl- antiporter ClcA